MVGGKLNLKGGLSKKKKRKHESAISEQSEASACCSAATSTLPSTTASDLGASASANSSSGHTAAELRHIERKAQRTIERIEKGELKSHRERVKDFNDYLGSLTEHYDLPKVSKGN